jgi:hypothetical protein
MIKKFSNPCSRCGKERVLLRKWIEEIPTYNNKTTKVTRALNVCPDIECQKIVDADLTEQRRKRDKIKDEREKKQLEAAAKKQLDKEDKEKLLESVI